MRAKFRGKMYTIKQRSNAQMKTAWGSCDDPNSKSPKILFNEKLWNTKRLLEVLLHESLHAVYFDLGEEAIREGARDVANFLKRMGVVVSETNGGSNSKGNS